MAEIIPLPARKLSADDGVRFARYLAFYQDGASMSQAQWVEHLKEPAFRLWLRDNGLALLIR